jgi:MoaA/NifB/PqqE/SkfB family radical SAM enzyme
LLGSPDREQVRGGLAPGVSLLIEDVPTLHCDPARTRLLPQPLSPLDALALALYDATGSSESAAAGVARVLDEDEARSRTRVEEILARYRRYLGVAREREPALPSRELLARCLAKVSRGPAPAPRATGPAELTWIVTYQCHLACAYCYVHTEAPNAASDSTLPAGRVLEVLDEASALGAVDLNLRGGEPFLRRDLPELIVAAAERGYHVDVNTKLPPTGRSLGLLARAPGLYLGLSLDSVDPRVGDRLLGGRGFTRRLQHGVREAARRGIEVGIEATVTRDTLDGLPALYAFACASGARRFHVREVAPHPRADISRLLLDHGQRERLASWCSAMRPGAPLEFHHSPAFSGRGHCGEGVAALTFLPDGRVSKCTASLSRDTRMHYGDLRRQSVAEVWNGSPLADLLRRVRGEEDGAEALQRARFVPCSQLRLMRSGELLPGAGGPA